MTIAVKVEAHNLKAFDKVGRALAKLPSEMGEAGYEIAKKQQRSLRLNLTRNKTKWTGNLWNSIKARKISDKQSVVNMAGYGFYLDRMTPHYVKMRRSSLIWMWAMTRKGVSPDIIEIALREGSIRVHAHPFIASALASTQSKIRGILNRRLRNALTVGG